MSRFKKIIFAILLLLLFGCIGFGVAVYINDSFYQATLKVPGISDLSKLIRQKETDAFPKKKKEKGKKNKKNTEKVDLNIVQNAKKDEDSVRLSQTEKESDLYLDKILFLGDSRTVGFKTYGYIDSKQMLAIVGLSHVDAPNRSYPIDSLGYSVTFDNYISTTNYPYIYICYGINGVGYLTEDSFKENYKLLVERVKRDSPNSQIVIQSIMPIIEGMPMTSDMTNEQIDQYNDFLYDLACEEGCYFLDIQEIMKDENGSLDSKYCVGDGLHFNELAYEIINEYILTHPVKEK